MSIDSVFVLNNNSGYSHPPNPSEIIVKKNYKPRDLQNIAIEFFQKYKTQSQQAYPLIEIKESICAYVVNSDLLFLMIYSSEIPILLVYQYLYNLVDIIKTSHGTILNSIILKNNKISVHIVSPENSP